MAGRRKQKTHGTRAAKRKANRRSKAKGAPRAMRRASRARDGAAPSDAGWKDTGGRRAEEP